MSIKDIFEKAVNWLYEQFTTNECDDNLIKMLQSELEVY